MEFNKKRFAQLLERYATNQCSKAELEELFSSIGQMRERDELEAYLTQMWHQAGLRERIPEPDWTTMYPKITSVRPIARRLRRLSAVAASVILAVGVVYLYLHLTGSRHEDHLGQTTHDIDIAPGGNRATLTLADGRTIDLSEAQAGIVIGDGITYEDGSFVTDGRPETDDGSQLTPKLQLTTPKGGQYQATLPDGTKVWLNAASTLRYPLQFGDDARIVELEGEAYFEVAQEKAANGKTPFIVETSGQVVEVLGTEFNLSAYADEPDVKTTLVNGSLSVSQAQMATQQTIGPTILVPGQQSTLRNGQIMVAPADIESVTAWKNGYFKFNSEPLESIMRKLARWYDVEVVYESRPQRRFGGTVSRFSNVSEVLEMLELTGSVSFRMEADKIIIE